MATAPDRFKLTLASIATQLPFEAIYRDVQFGPELDDDP
jgi:hypothetical protein